MEIILFRGTFCTVRVSSAKEIRNHKTEKNEKRRLKRELTVRAKKAGKQNWMVLVKMPVRMRLSRVINEREVSSSIISFFLAVLLRYNGYITLCSLRYTTQWFDVCMCVCVCIVK